VLYSNLITPGRLLWTKNDFFDPNTGIINNYFTFRKFLVWFSFGAGDRTQVLAHIQEL
jgi:hypothetical protein